MLDYYNLFKTDFFAGVTNLSKSSWKNVLVAYAIYYGSQMIFGLIIATITLLGAIDMNLFTDMMASSPSEDSLLIFKKLAEILMTPEFIIPMLALMVLLFILASWNYYFAFLACNAEVKNKKHSFSELFKLSFSSAIFKIAGLTIVLNIIITLLFLAAISSAALSGILAFMLFIVACIVSVRFLLVLPAYIIGNYDFSSSFAFSFYHIDWQRALKIFGIAFLALMILFGVAMLVGLISAVFALIPVIGVIIQMGISIVLGSTIMVVVVAGLTGLYYRYAEATTNNEEVITAAEN